MTKKVIKIFILTTIAVMLLIIALLLIYIIKFKDTGNTETANTTNTKKVVKTEKEGILNEALPDAENEEVIRGIIFLGDKEDKNLISSAYYVNFDRQENKLSFYNLPGDMVFETSNELYKEISTSLADIPQVLKLSHLYKYSKNKQGLKAGMLMLEEYLDLGISHYLFLRAEDAEKIFYFNAKGASTFLQDFINNVVNGSDEERNAFINSVYNEKFTDIKKKVYTTFIKQLKDVKTENISFTTIKGERFDNGVVVNKEVIYQTPPSENE